MGRDIVAFAETSLRDEFRKLNARGIRERCETENLSGNMGYLSMRRMHVLPSKTGDARFAERQNRKDQIEPGAWTTITTPALHAGCFVIHAMSHLVFVGTIPSAFAA
jgi:hypothetical protein